MAFTIWFAFILGMFPVYPFVKDPKRHTFAIIVQVAGWVFLYAYNSIVHGDFDPALLSSREGLILLIWCAVCHLWNIILGIRGWNYLKARHAEKAGKADAVKRARQAEIAAVQAAKAEAKWQNSQQSLGDRIAHAEKGK